MLSNGPGDPSVMNSSVELVKQIVATKKPIFGICLGHQILGLSQGLKTENNELYKEVLKTALTWKNAENLMFVVGATKAEYFSEIRKIVPNHFLLVPGVGAQGGNLQDVCKYGLNKDCGLLINSSRGIIYAGNDQNFAESAKKEALKLQQEMEQILNENS